MKPEVHVHANLEELSRAAARAFMLQARRRIDESGRFTVALSGGSTPRRLYEILGSPDFATLVEWAKVHLFQVDERCAPPDDLYSNFRMIRKALLEPAKIPTANFHRVRGELPPSEAAERYEEELAVSFGIRPPDFPPLDLIFLGMGADGHTASLFPGSRNLAEVFRWAVPGEPGPEGLDRVTLTLPLINHAAHIIFLVSGVEKSETLARVMAPRGGDAALPAQRVAPHQGQLEWLCDRAAAEKLNAIEQA